MRMNMNKKKLDFNDVIHNGKQLYYTTQVKGQNAEFDFDEHYYDQVLLFMDTAMDELNRMNRRIFGLEKQVENYREKEYKYRRSL